MMTSENSDSTAATSREHESDVTDANSAHDDAHEIHDDAHGVTEEEIASRRAALMEIIEMLRPAVQIDGGDLELIEADYINGIIEVELQGACGSCAVSGATLTGGVERIMKERLEWVTEVVGGVDEEIDQLESAALGRGAYVPKYY
jgi:Fe-S cluster biogenesis protein NfuA